MKESIIDTNIILRYLTADIPEQAERCGNLLKKAVEGKEEIEIPLLVLAETLWTLVKFYKVPKTEAVEVLNTLLREPKIKVKDKKIILEALELYKDNNISFTDCYLAVYSSQNNKNLYSFDGDFAKIGFKSEEPE